MNEKMDMNKFWATRRKILVHPKDECDTLDDEDNKHTGKLAHWQRHMWQATMKPVPSTRRGITIPRVDKTERMHCRSRN